MTYTSSLLRGMALGAMCMAAGLPALVHAHGLEHHQKLSAQAADKKGWFKAPRKPHGSGIDLRYRYATAKAFYQVGEAVTIEFETTGSNGKDSSLEIWHDNALSLARPKSSAALSKTANGYGKALAAQKQTLSITVTPQSEGLHYVQVQTQQDGKGSVAAIAVRVGDKPLNLPTTGELKTLPGGRKIIEMQAH
jgi:hypothetical protein